MYPLKFAGKPLSPNDLLQKLEKNTQCREALINKVLRDIDINNDKSALPKVLRDRFNNVKREIKATNLEANLKDFFSEIKNGPDEKLKIELANYLIATLKGLPLGTYKVGLPVTIDESGKNLKIGSEVITFGETYQTAFTPKFCIQKPGADKWDLCTNRQTFELLDLVFWSGDLLSKLYDPLKQLTVDSDPELIAIREKLAAFQGSSTKSVTIKKDAKNETVDPKKEFIEKELRGILIKVLSLSSSNEEKTAEFNNMTISDLLDLLGEINTKSTTTFEQINLARILRPALVVLAPHLREDIDLETMIRAIQFQAGTKQSHFASIKETLRTHIENFLIEVRNDPQVQSLLPVDLRDPDNVKKLPLIQIIGLLEPILKKESEIKDKFKQIILNINPDAISLFHAMAITSSDSEFTKLDKSFFTQLFETLLKQDDLRSKAEEIFSGKPIVVGDKQIVGIKLPTYASACDDFKSIYSSLVTKLDITRVPQRMKDFNAKIDAINGSDKSNAVKHQELEDTAIELYKDICQNRVVKDNKPLKQQGIFYKSDDGPIAGILNDLLDKIAKHFALSFEVTTDLYGNNKPTPMDADPMKRAAILELRGTAIKAAEVVVTSAPLKLTAGAGKQ